MRYFLDTSAILNGALNTYPHSYISPIVLMELESIKTSFNKSEDIKYKARKAIKNILNSSTLEYTTISQRKIQKYLKNFSFLSDINDHRLICEAAITAQDSVENIIFITSDGAQYLLAKQVPYLEVQFYQEELNQNIEDEFCGWSKYYPNNNQLNLLYSDPQMNVLKCKTNEFAEIYQGSELKDILFWTGNRYRPLKYKDIKNSYLGETIKPRNLEQKMAFDLLQNQDIKVKLLTSAWGGGKTLIALNYALEQIARGTYQKLVFVRNNIIAAGTNDIGYLPGDVRQKLSIFTRCIADHVGGEEKLEELMDDRIIEAIPLSHIRGRSIKDSIVLCDECENMDDRLVTLLMSRIEDDSELIFCGDVAQIDNKKFEQHNGIRSMLKNLAGEPLFGTVKLIKSERGPVPRLCDKMIPPI